MSDFAIRVSELSKRYRLGIRHAGSLQEVVSTATRRLFGGPQRIPATSTEAQTESQQKREFWALHDVTFDISPGEVVGIIGGNGAGKSTLLKILSRITKPTSGFVERNGRVASLLEVGTGFHPELTGRENVYLNGAILGMTRTEIRRQFPDIVEFSEIGEFLDTPVKHYSSGMYVRLAFAVAAHLQPEILIVDEVLAVGDAAFQKKCLGKLRDSGISGRTVLFVSHQMGSVLQLCNRAVYLKNGRVVFTGSPQEAVDRYLGQTESQAGGFYTAPEIDSPKDLRILRAECVDQSDRARSRFNHDESFRVVIRCSVSRRISGAEIRLAVRDSWSRVVFVSDCALDFSDVTDGGEVTAAAEIPATFLRPGRYIFGMFVILPHIMIVDGVHEGFSISVVDGGSRYAVSEGMDYGCVFSPCSWSFRGSGPVHPSGN